MRLIDEIREAADRSDFDELAEVVGRLAARITRSGSPLSVHERKAVLKALRDHRRFDEIVTLTEAMLSSGCDSPASEHYDPSVRRHHAQALIDQGRLTAAADVISTGIGISSSTSKLVREEHNELVGLMGRVHKQRYVERYRDGVLGRDTLVSAINWYALAAHGRWMVDAHWPHINYIALLARAEREGLAMPGQSSSKALAKNFLDACRAADDKTLLGHGRWLSASIAEAYIALGQWDAAARALDAYMSDKGVTAFEVYGTLRQLREVWQLDADTDAGGELVTMLSARLAKMAQGQVVFPGGLRQARQAMNDNDLQALEAVLGSEGPKSIRWLRNGLKAAESVARVRLMSGTQTYGTAFVVRGGDLFAHLGDEAVAVTNAHVVSPERHGLVRPEGTGISLDEAADEMLHELSGEVLYLSAPQDLDCIVLRLKRPSRVQAVLRADQLRALPSSVDDLKENERTCTVIGHPRGQDLSISFGSSQLIDIGFKSLDRREHCFLRYTTPTLDGNSGSPVFDDAWGLIGLHRLGVNAEGKVSGIPRLNGVPETHVANEGVSFATIKAEIASRRIAPITTSAASAGAPPLPAENRVATFNEKIKAGNEGRQKLAAELLALVEDQSIPDEQLLDIMQVEERAVEDWIPLPEEAGKANLEAPGSVSELMLYAGAVALSKAFRHRRNTRFSQIEPAWEGLRIISDGDSWFQFPRPRIKDVIDHLEATGRYAISCGAIAGTEFGQIFAQPGDLMKSIRTYRADVLLLSGGGNDLLGYGKVVNNVKDFDPKLTPEAYLEPVLDHKINEIVATVEGLIKRAIVVKPDVHVFCHGYDRALPKKYGPWLSGPLSKQRGIESRVLQARIVAALLDKFNDRMIEMTGRFGPTVHFVDCRGAVQGAHEWYDELHPNNAGFAKVAARFDKAIRRQFRGDPRLRKTKI